MLRLKSTPYFDIELDNAKKHIRIIQKWQYQWLTLPHTNYWTYERKKEFHYQAERLIWETWSGKFYLDTIKTDSKQSIGEVPERYTLSFDVKWVLSSPHWQVFVYKCGVGENIVTRLLYQSRKIYLKTRDLNKNLMSLEVPRSSAIPHEFGHTFYNDEEYGIDNGNSFDPAYVDDKKSVMNIGNEVRRRHLYTITKELEIMFPDRVFIPFKV